MKRAVIALSGGMDSITLFHWALANGYELEAVSFYYGQNHNKELECAEYHCEKNNVPHKVIDITFLGEITKGYSSLTSGAEEIPEGMYDAENMKSTVVPFRNGIILSILASYAEVKDCDFILYGIHSGDHAIYPDCRPEFNKAVSEAIYQGTYNGITVEAPFEKEDKITILKQGIEFGVSYDKTWTCYKGGEQPCGKCGSCVERVEAFLENDIVDPLYSEENWRVAVQNYLDLRNGN